MNINNQKENMIIEKEIEEDIEEEENICDIIDASAIKKSRPGLFSDKKNISTNLEKEIILSNKKKEFLEKTADYVKNIVERINIKRKKSPSDKVIKEVMEYYRSLYISKNPNLKELKRLILRNIRIDFPNNYIFGEPEFFEYHENGTLSADINMILSYTLNNVIIKFDEEKINKVKDKKWLTLEESQEYSLYEQQREEKEKYELAIQSWAIIVSYINNIDYLKKNIHMDNIKIASVDVLSNYIDNSYTTKEKYIDGIIKLNILDPLTINKIMNKKEIRKDNYIKREENLNKNIDKELKKEINKKVPDLSKIKSKIKEK